MIKTISSVLAAFAAVTFAGFSGEASAQSCSSCGPVHGAQTVQNFAYPNTGCSHGGCQSGHGAHGQSGHGHKVKQHFHNLKQQFAFTSANNEKIAARNDAWPLPFTCWDKTGYYDTWAPMLSKGSEIHAVLDKDYFTGGNELNRLGIDRVRGIVQNMPASQRTVYVHRSGDDFIDKARVDDIRNTISTYYAASGPVEVRLSDEIPTSIAGTSIINSRASRVENLPPPIIPVASGGSVDQAVTQ